MKYVVEVAAVYKITVADEKPTQAVITALGILDTCIERSAAVEIAALSVSELKQLED